MKNPLTCTVRKVMRKHGHTDIWTNLRKSVRTVKCYSTDANADIRVIRDIVSELNAIGVSNEKYDIYKTDPKLSIGRHQPGLIVSFPL
jgi:hypothetical protein